MGRANTETKPEPENATILHLKMVGNNAMALRLRLKHVPLMGTGPPGPMKDLAAPLENSIRSGTVTNPPR